MKIAFLDVDGVINPLLKSLGSGHFSSVACEHISTMFIKEPQLRIVISSSWRRWGLDVMRDILKNNGIDPTKVIDITTDKGGWMPENRDKQIKDWLDAHPEVTQYVVLDDYPMPKFKENQVKTNGYIGFTEKDMQEALSILAGTAKST